MPDSYSADGGSVSKGQQPRKRSEKASSKTAALVLLVAIAGFAVGARSDEIIRTVGPMFGMKVAATDLNYDEIEATYKNLAKYYDGKLDAETLEEGASRGLVEAAGDRYTTYLSKKEAAEFEKELSGDIGGGIGAEIGMRNDTPTIIRVLPGNPAQQAGLQAGDAIVAVNGEDAAGRTVEDVVQDIRGEVGTSVKITIFRDGEPKEVAVTRAEVNNPSVQSSIDGTIGTLTLTRFDTETGSLARSEAMKLKNAGVEKVILDLRGNGGGYVTAAQAVAGIWLDNKVIMIEKRDGKTVDELKSTGEPVLAGMPTVVLVNGSSASASEIIAGAFKEYGTAKIVGEKTFGKGSVQQMIDLPEGAKLKVTIAKWYTPKGTNITKHGITPDTAIELTAEDANAGRDLQLEEAKKQLRAV